MSAHKNLRVGLFGIGLDTYWPQFPGLKPRLASYLRAVQKNLERPGVEVVNLGLIDNPKKALVAGTSNKSEILVGYSTQFGDAAAAFLPIGDLYKTQVFELARHLDIPEEIIAKKPSADLWPGQTDEGEIGITYHDLDIILHLMVDKRWDEGEIVERGFTLTLVRRIKKMIAASQFKRTMPPVTKLHARTVGIDFRYLRDWNK